MKMWYRYTTGYYSAVKNNDVTNSEDKWMELEKNYLELGNPDTEGQTTTQKWILSIK